jgi:tetraacyldisaccharide 4'-kinase
MRPPRFWQEGGAPPWPLATLSRLYAAATARRMARPGWTAPVPVICCGNAGTGGSGKTPLAIDLAKRLTARGLAVAFLSRGHGGRLRGPLLVDPSFHGADDVGDEPLLLARVAPVYIGADRAASARLAIAAGAEVLVMDDGLQNPTLAKTLSLLVVDGAVGFGNGHVIPAGPLREPTAVAARRCQACVVVGRDMGAADGLGLPVLRAWLTPSHIDLPEKLVAFAGIGRPEKFFDSLRAAGHTPLATLAFADHHRYMPADLRRIHRLAERHGATPVTTEKDLVRLAPPLRAGLLTLPVTLDWEDATMIETLLDRVLGR